MTLNGEMAFILRYPTEFGSHVKLCFGLGHGAFWSWSLSWAIWSCLTMYCYALCFWSQNCIRIWAIMKAP